MDHTDGPEHLAAAQRLLEHELGNLQARESELDDARLCVISLTTQRDNVQRAVTNRQRRVDELTRINEADALRTENEQLRLTLRALQAEVAENGE